MRGKRLKDSNLSVTMNAHIVLWNMVRKNRYFLGSQFLLNRVPFAPLSEIDYNNHTTSRRTQ